MGKIKGSFARNYDRFIHRIGLLPEGLSDLVRSMKVNMIADFACGTGNVAIGLSLEGYEVTGVDYSPDMLRVARAKARAYKAGTKFVSKDIATADLGKRYDLILCLGNATPHFTDKKSLHRLLANSKRHLNPGGRIIFQQLNYDRMLKEGSGTFAIDFDDQIVRFKQNIFRGLKAEFHVTIIDGRIIPPRITRSKRILKPWLRDELKDSLRRSGFSKTRFIGNYRGEPFTLKSKDLIVVGVS